MAWLKWRGGLGSSKFWVLFVTLHLEREKNHLQSIRAIQAGKINGRLHFFWLKEPIKYLLVPIDTLGDHAFYYQQYEIHPFLTPF